MGSNEGSRSLEASTSRKLRYKDSLQDDQQSRGCGSAINWTMCVLCMSSLVVSGLLAYRELRLEERVSALENLCQLPGQYQQQQQQQQNPSDVIIERLKRELQQQIDDVQKKLALAPEGPTGIFRLKRDVADCNCPPGWLIF
ncbi:hypothetical protein TSAR_015850 [Trichomalopsis sarcophagae]|uniref:Uncharacterized protein n=1 Tax=Trichomalopsis sarcophagae TaxID=543379 RepID=A0A232FAZ0_9HYME|nr:hypothetical protein TSAR_015850 [Trichomalopsis sarcophagae]